MDLVCEAEVEVWQQQGLLKGKDAHLPFFGLPRVTTDTNDVTTAQFVVDGYNLLV